MTCLAFLISFGARANKDCGESCFASEVISINPTEGGCYEYTLNVSWSGDCKAALSHYTVEVPCGEISNVSNSENWKQEVGMTDPTSGLYGFKIDDIKDFGEEGSPESFTVTFTVCPDEQECETDLSCWAPTVAYKAATCVYYDTLSWSCKNLDATLITTNATCSDSNDGSIEVNIVDGNEPFTYLWSTGDTSKILSGLPGGIYAVVVQDAHGDTLNLTAEILSPEPLDLTYDISHTTCSGNSDGSISVSASGGVGPYSYLWSTGSTENALTGLIAGDYDVLVTDSLGCTYSQTFTVESSNTISIAGIVTKSSCSASDGSIDLTLSGGTGNYTISWSDGESTEDRTNLSPGFYTVNVTDDGGCEASRTFSVKEDNPLKLSGSITPTGCPDDSTGSISVSVSGNSGEVSYLWDTGETTSSIEGLSKGRYEVTVTDPAGCNLTKGFYVYGETIEVVSEIQQPSCYESADGAIDLTVSEDVSISWSNGETGASISGLTEGLYTATLVNPAGCEATYSYFIDGPDSLSFTYTVSNATCDPALYTVSITGSGGNSSYTATWEDEYVGLERQELVEGTYNVVLTDSKGCTATGAITVDPASAGCDNTDDTTDTPTDDDTSDTPSDDDGDDNSDDGSGDDDGSDGDDGNSDDDGSDGDGSDGNDSDDPIADNGCSDPFDVSIVKVEDGDCSYYEAVITYNGDKSYGLSHASISSSCGDLTAVYTEIGHFETGVDPTTGVDGLKVDNIENFGEGSEGEDFMFSFELCSGDCEEGSEVEFVVAYKYGQCVSYDTINVSLETTTSSTAYPNPASGSVNFSLSGRMSSSEYITIELYNPFGTMVKMLKEKASSNFSMNVSDLPADIYTYRIISDNAVETGKIMVTH